MGSSLGISTGASCDSRSTTHDSRSTNRQQRGIRCNAANHSARHCSVITATVALLLLLASGAQAADLQPDLLVHRQQHRRISRRADHRQSREPVWLHLRRHGRRRPDLGVEAAERQLAVRHALRLPGRQRWRRAAARHLRPGRRTLRRHRRRRNDWLGDRISSRAQSYVLPHRLVPVGENHSVQLYRRL